MTAYPLGLFVGSAVPRAAKSTKNGLRATPTVRWLRLREVGHHVADEAFDLGGAGGGPAAGRGVSELIVYGGFRTLDLSEVGYERIAEGRPFLEKAVI